MVMVLGHRFDTDLSSGNSVNWLIINSSGSAGKPEGAILKTIAACMWWLVKLISFAVLPKATCINFPLLGGFDF